MVKTNKCQHNIIHCELVPPLSPQRQRWANETGSDTLAPSAEASSYSLTLFTIHCELDTPLPPQLQRWANETGSDALAPSAEASSYFLTFKCVGFESRELSDHGIEVHNTVQLSLDYSIAFVFKCHVSATCLRNET